MDLDLLREAQKLKAQGHEWSQVADLLNEKYGQNLTAEAIRSRVKRHKDKITYEDRVEPPTEFNLEEYWDAMVKATIAKTRLSTQQTDARLTINEQAPVGLIFTGDWHIGCDGTDYAQLEHDIDVWRNTPGLYTIGMGDYKDNYVTGAPPGGGFHASAPPGVQSQLVFFQAMKLKDKALAWCKGCHDDWDERQTNRDFIQELAEKTDAINLWHGGVLYITLGSEVYKVAARHKFPFASNLNTTNSQRQLFHSVGGADIVAIGHLHYNDLQMKTQSGIRTVWFRSGSYKVGDEYGQKIGGYAGEPIQPMAILLPDQHKVIAYPDYRDGLDHLALLRERYQRVVS